MGQGYDQKCLFSVCNIRISGVQNLGKPAYVILERSLICWCLGPVLTNNCFVLAVAAAVWLLLSQDKNSSDICKDWSTRYAAHLLFPRQFWFTPRKNGFESQLIVCGLQMSRLLLCVMASVATVLWGNFCLLVTRCSSSSSSTDASFSEISGRT